MGKLALIQDICCTVSKKRKYSTGRALLNKKEKIAASERSKFNKKINFIKNEGIGYLTGRAAKPNTNYRKTNDSPVCNIIYAGSISILILIACAHKASPLVKDRLSPKLQEVRALNNRQIQFTFTEELDTLQLGPENFSITGGNDTLTILTVYQSLSAAEIIAITEAQVEKTYEATGYVFDAAANKGTFKKTFRGSIKPDTISPWLTGYSEGENNQDFILQFSEAMDTSFLEFDIIPTKNLQPLWHNIRTCQLIAETSVDSLHYDTTYYLYVNRGARDMSGNYVDLFITAITPDTIYSPLILRGKVMIHDTLAQVGLAVLQKEIALGITKVQKGEFAFEVRDSSIYTIEVVSSKFSGSAEASVAQENVIVLKEEERNIDSIIH